MTAQEASTMIRAKVNPIIVLVNNQGAGVAARS